MKQQQTTRSVTQFNQKITDLRQKNTERKVPGVKTDKQLENWLNKILKDCRYFLEKKEAQMAALPTSLQKAK